MSKEEWSKVLFLEEEIKRLNEIIMGKNIINNGDNTGVQIFGDIVNSSIIIYNRER
ncbi:MAG: hypothetical protein ACRCXY_03480 [Fusobacteriaceae bacterium]